MLDRGVTGSESFCVASSILGTAPRLKTGLHTQQGGNFFMRLLTTLGVVFALALLFGGAGAIADDHDHDREDSTASKPPPRSSIWW
jgi:hypothetical protein